MRQQRPNAPEPEQKFRDPWQIHSVPIRARDGPERLAQVYQLLLQPGSLSHTRRTTFRPSRVSGYPVSQAKEGSHAGRDLRPRLHPTPGA
jgi:hypothetical protein